MLGYDELRIRVRKVGTRRYLVLANGPACAAEVVVLDRDPAEYRRTFERLISMELGTEPTGGRPVVPQLRQLGREVFALLFPDAVARCLAESRARVSARPDRALRLRFDLPPELRDLPVEALASPADSPLQALALDHNLSLVRSLPTDGAGVRPRLPDGATPREVIHLLVAVASPNDPATPPLAADREVEALHERLPVWATKVTLLRGATRAELGEWLAEHANDPCAVLLIAHGRYDPDEGGLVYLEGEDGLADPVPGSTLGGMLVRAQQLRLAVLNLCSGATSVEAEPYAGLAQALIGRGVPAVVAMQAQVTDLAAGRFSPFLLDQVARNKTIDEAVATARSHLAPVARHTGIEWSTPVLFLHPSCYHGWLFKAREVLGDRQPVSIDPLRELSDAWRHYQEAGAVNLDDVLRAARYLVTTGDWEGVLRTASTPHPRAEQRWLMAEARVELAADLLDRLCAVLAAEGDPEPARALVTALRKTRLPEPVRAVVLAEVTGAERLAEALAGAAAAEVDGDWGTAVQRYDAVLAERPAGYRDAVSRRAAAQVEAELAEAYATARVRTRDGDWSGAADRYREILARRPDGYRDSAACLAYASGRLAEADERWADATEHYGGCPDLPDAADRRRYAEGRAAIARESWAAAIPALTGLTGPAEDWLRYATGRLAEEEQRWADAIAAYAELPDFADAPARGCLAEARFAADRDDPLGALRAVTAAQEHGADVTGWLDGYRDRVLERALAAEGDGDWTQAWEHYRALPAASPDVAGRTAYVRGRLDERDGDWAAAVVAYGSTAHADAAARLAYARGRLLEVDGCWAEAVGRYETVPGDLLDVRDRLCYARGRAADERGDWSGVIAGFGPLANAYGDGAVGRIRDFARAGLADRRQDWDAVLVSLRDLPDEDHAGRAGVLRCRAYGRRHQAAGRWSEAAAAYGSRAADDPELAVRYGYARGRAYEQAGAWGEAVDAYAGLPEDHDDVAHRRTYAQGRLAEQDGTDPDWAGAQAAYARLPLDFEDVTDRLGYARARLADAADDWAGVVREAEPLDGYRDAARLGDYARARLAEGRDDWPAALDLYLACGEHRDAVARCAYARGRILDAAGQWSAAVTAYRSAAPAQPDADARARRLERLLDALPWADGLAGAPLVADPYALRDPTFPYLALRAAGITPAATPEEINDAPFTLMESGGMSWSERVAWDHLRSPARRLRLDALLYPVADLDELRARLTALVPDRPGQLLDGLCAALPGHAPLLLLLARDRDRAIEAWEARVAAVPNDLAAVHALAIAHFWRARELEDSGAWEHAGPAWERALACWAVVLTDDGYWVSWRAARTGAYGHAGKAGDLARLRRELAEDLLARLTGYADGHAGQGRSEPAARYRRLIEVFDTEMAGARALKEAGSLPLPGTGDRFACGPAYLHRAGLAVALGEQIARLEADAGPDGDPALQRLRFAFSELAPAFALTEHHRFEPALRALPGIQHQTLTGLPPDCAGPGSDVAGHLAHCPHCPDFVARNPAYLLLPGRRARLLQDAVDLAVRAHLALARGALVGGPGGVDRAVGEWAEAIRAAENAMSTVRTKRAIVRIVLGRVQALADEDGPRLGEHLDEGVALIERVMPLLGAIDRERLLARLAELLTERGVWHGYVCHRYGGEPDFRRAESDLRRALELRPDSVRTRDNLVRALVFNDGPGAGDPAARLRVLYEALLLVHDGLNRQPGRRRFIGTLEHALGDLAELILARRSFAELADLMGAEDVPAGDPADRARALLARAEASRAAGDRTGALYDLVRAALLDPDNPRIRQALLDALAEDQRDEPDLRDEPDQRNEPDLRDEPDEPGDRPDDGPTT
ncbi:MAG: hypothetical protein AUI14_20435 [Actinobacteria bacterium 13_2_20CM_2_71_6]|nr:MAG: hypothetical protein AUI14_20435 [Actinobacteria bacterium 13_2_20CM_2_71_6]